MPIITANSDSPHAAVDDSSSSSLSYSKRLLDCCSNRYRKRNVIANAATASTSLSRQQPRYSSSSRKSDSGAEIIATTTTVTPKMASSDNSGEYQTVERGALNTLDYRLYFKDSNGKLISPWHDIPLFASESSQIYNMVVEIPRWTNAKMEMSTKEPLNPIRQDSKNNMPRFVHNIFPHRGYIWNYGALPQTWENPEHKDEHTGALGDNDPIDIIELGGRVHNRGAVVKVKILGVLALLDEGETDWKLVGLDVEDPMAETTNTLADVEKHLPGLLTATQEWFRIYKRPTGKPNNQFAFNGRFKEKEFAYEIIAETHKFWRQLIEQPSPKLNTECNVAEAAHPADQQKWTEEVASKPEPSDPAQPPADLDKWAFVQD